MDHQLGRIDLITWQGRRLRTQPRLDSATALLTGLALAAGAVLLLRFVFGLDIPLPILQTAFAVLASSTALLLTRAAASLLIRAQRR